MYFCPMSEAGADAEGSAQETDTFFQAEQPQPTSRHSGQVLNKPLPIVMDADADPSGSPQHSHNDLRCFCVFEDVLEGFLRHAVQAGGEIHGESFGKVA